MGSALNAFSRVNPETKLGQFSRAIAPLIEAPSNILIASDIYFKMVARDNILDSIATRDGLNAEERQKFLEDPYDEALAEANEFACRVTFTDKPGKFLRTIMTTRDKDPTFFLISTIPFINTLANIFKRGIELTPGIGLVSAIPTRAEPTEAQRRNRDRGSLVARQPIARTLAHQISGATIAYLFLSMFDEDEITDAVPESRPERDVFYASGRLPYSVKMSMAEGDYWISYRRAEPFNTVLGIISAAKRALKELRYDEQRMDKVEKKRTIDQATEIFTAVSDAMVGTAVGSTWTENLFGLLQDNGFSRRLLAHGAQTIANFIPAASFMRQVSRVLQARTEGQIELKEHVLLASQISNTLPWDTRLSEMLKPKMNVLGEEVSIPGGVLRQWIPIKWDDAARRDAVEEELIDLHYYPTLPPRSALIGRVPTEIPEDLYYRYSLAYGAVTKKAIERAISLPGYQKAKSIPDFHASRRRRMRILERMIGRARKPVNARMRRELRSMVKSSRRARR